MRERGNSVAKKTPNEWNLKPADTTPEAAQRVPPTNEESFEVKFDAKKWRLNWLIDTADLSSIKHVSSS